MLCDSPTPVGREPPFMNGGGGACICKSPDGARKVGAVSGRVAATTDPEESTTIPSSAPGAEARPPLAFDKPAASSNSGSTLRRALTNQLLICAIFSRVLLAKSSFSASNGSVRDNRKPCKGIALQTQNGTVHTWSCEMLLQPAH